MALGVNPDKQAEVSMWCTTGYRGLVIYRVQVFQCVAGVLHLGNIDFDSVDGESVNVSEESKQNLNTAAILFQAHRYSFVRRCLN